MNPQLYINTFSMHANNYRYTKISSLKYLNNKTICFHKFIEKQMKHYDNIKNIKIINFFPSDSTD